MKTFCFIVALICIPLTAQAIPELELKEQPPIEPLHYCKDSEGKVKAYREECEFGTTEVSSIRKFNADGSSTHLELGATMDGAASNGSEKTSGTANRTDINAIPTEDASTETTEPTNNGEGAMKKGRMFRMLGIAIAFGVIAKLIGRSFLLWFFLGAGVDFLLVVLNVLPH
jgi:hypothetical protein